MSFQQSDSGKEIERKQIEEMKKQLERDQASGSNAELLHEVAMPGVTMKINSK